MNKVATTPQFPRPAFVLDAKVEFEALAAEHPDLAFVDAVVVDLCGALRGKRLPVGEARKIFESGIQLPHSIYLMDARGEMTNPFGCGFIMQGMLLSCSTGFPGECARGTASSTHDRFSGGCVPDNMPSVEVCDGKDNDCDGETDEGCD